MYMQTMHISTDPPFIAAVERIRRAQGMRSRSATVRALVAAADLGTSTALPLSAATSTTPDELLSTFLATWAALATWLCPGEASPAIACREAIRLKMTTAAPVFLALERMGYPDAAVGPRNLGCVLRQVSGRRIGQRRICTRPHRDGVARWYVMAGS